MMTHTWIQSLQWNDKGLIPVITQEKETGVVLMMAWMNQEALLQTAQTKQATYWSRSRGKIWVKGERSTHTQTVHEIRTDCDKDTLLLIVTQQGGMACHTGRHHCFFQKLQHNEWINIEPVIQSPESIYRPSEEDT